MTRKIALRLMLSVWLLPLVACASGDSFVLKTYDFSQIKKVAVVKVTGVRAEGVKNQLSDLLAFELGNKGYHVVERHQVQEVLKEKEFQGKDIAEADDVRKAGKILGVQAVVIINVSRMTDRHVDLSAKMLDVKDGVLIWGGSGSGKHASGFSTLLGAAAGVVIGKEVGGTGGAIIGGIVGGVSGKQLAPEIQSQTRSIFRQLASKLPERK